MSDEVVKTGRWKASKIAAWDPLPTWSVIEGPFVLFSTTCSSSATPIRLLAGA